MSAKMKNRVIRFFCAFPEFIPTAAGCLYIFHEWLPYAEAGLGCASLDSIVFRANTTTAIEAALTFIDDSTTGE